MYEYLIDEISWSGSFDHAPEAGYRQALHKRAQQGWRLVQVLTIWDGAERLPCAHHLIFERPLDAPTGMTGADDGDTRR